MGLDDFAMFSSPWAVNHEVEEKFESTIDLLGNILYGHPDIMPYFVLLLWTTLPHCRDTPFDVVVSKG